MKTSAPLTRPQFTVLFAALATGLAMQSAWATNGYFAHGYGVKSAGIAGVGIAWAEDGLAAASNPAGTGLVGNRLDVGLSYFAPDRGASVSGNQYGLNGSYDGNGKSYFLLPELGYTRQLNAQTAVGVALYGNGGMNTEYKRNPFATLGGQGTAGVNLEQLFITPSLSYQVAPQQSIGVGLNLAYQRFSAQGIQPFSGASAAPTHVSNQGTDSSTGAGVRLGWNGQIAPGLRAGITWASKITGRFDKYKGLFADQGSFDIPANYGAGLSYQPNSSWTFAADYQVIQYGKVKSIANPLSQLFSGNALGSANGPGFGWKDVTVIKVGGEYHLNDSLTLRAGYSHSDEPVPAQETFFNILAPGVVQEHLTAGATWKTSPHGEWSGYIAQAFKRTVQGKDSIPANFGGGNADVRLSETILGVAYGWKF